jgi:hypothetical protein
VRFKSSQLPRPVIYRPASPDRKRVHPTALHFAPADRTSDRERIRVPGIHTQGIKTTGLDPFPSLLEFLFPTSNPRPPPPPSLDARPDGPLSLSPLHRSIVPYTTTSNNK